MIYLDTNIILRYLLDDNKELSKKSKEIIDGNDLLFICDGVCAEIVYVLQKVYKVERNLLSETLDMLIKKNNIRVSDTKTLIKSLEIFAQLNLDYIDCLLLAYNITNKVNVQTFDEKLKKRIHYYK